MALHAKFDALEDRMLLTLRPPEGAGRAFWVTRRQWLALLDAVVALRLPDADPGLTSEPPLDNRKRAPGGPTAQAVPVQALRLRPAASGGAKLAFVAGENGAAMSLSDAGLEQLKQLLLQQAERAEWDVAAALERMHARKIANDVVRNAKRAN